MKAVLNHIWKFIKWLLDIIFGITVIIAVILIVSVIFFPHDNLLLELGKWLASRPL